MSVNQIQTWLQNPDRDYATGLNLYNSYKINNKYDAFFAQVTAPHPNSMHFKILLDKIKDINRKLLANPSLVKPEPITVKPINTDELKKKYNQRSKAIEPKRPTIVDNPLVDVKELPANLQKLYFENKDLVVKRAGQHEKMRLLDPSPKFNAERKVLAQEIIQFDNTIAANWLEIDTWWKGHTTIKAEKNSQKDIVMETLAKKRKVENLKIYIAREEKKIAADPEQELKLRPRIDGWKKELNELIAE
jgi:hypothetical protein